MSEIEKMCQKLGRKMKASIKQPKTWLKVPSEWWCNICNTETGHECMMQWPTKRNVMMAKSQAGNLIKTVIHVVIHLADQHPTLGVKRAQVSLFLGVLGNIQSCGWISNSSHMIGSGRILCCPESYLIIFRYFWRCFEKKKNSLNWTCRRFLNSNLSQWHILFPFLCLNLWNVIKMRQFDTQKYNFSCQVRTLVRGRMSLFLIVSGF